MNLPRNLSHRQCIAQSGASLRQGFGEQLYRFAPHRGLDARDVGCVQNHIDPVPFRPKFGAGNLLQRGRNVLPHLGPWQGQSETPILVRDPSKRGLGIRAGAFGNNRHLAPDTSSRANQCHKPTCGSRQKSAPPHQIRSAADRTAALIRA